MGMKCQYAPINCDECNNRICRAEYDLHRKQCLKSCQNCNISFCSSNERKLHYLNCPIFVHCKLCNQRMKKKDLLHHSKFLCPLRCIKCPFYHFGCHEVLKSVNLAKHLKFNSAQHYQLKVDHCINKIEIKAKLKQNNNLENQMQSVSVTLLSPDILLLC